MRLVRFGILLSFIPGLISLASAQSIEGFFKRFDLLKNSDGDIVRILDRTLDRDHARTLKETADDMKAAFQILKTKEFSKELISEMATSLRNNDDDKAASEKDYEAEIAKLLTKFKDIDFDKVVMDEKFQTVLKKFDDAVDEKMGRINFKTVANLEDASFYYRKNVIRAIAWEILDWARDAWLPIGIPYDVAEYLIKRYVKNFHRAKQYHQNILFYYLEAFSPERLGLAPIEWQRAMSSVMESNIDPLEFFEHRSAVRNWDGYGLKKLEKIHDKSAKRFERHADMFVNVRAKIGSYFVEVEKDDGSITTYNFYDNRRFLSSKPSTAYNSAHPKRVYRTRLFYELVNFATIFSPLGPVNTVVKKVMEQSYKKQMRREGSLYGYYEAVNNKVVADIILRQSMNPLERRYRLPEDLMEL